MKKMLLAWTLCLVFLPASGKSADIFYHIVGTRQILDAKTGPDITYLHAMAGLVPKVAVADGPWLIISGQPDTIDATLNGKPVCLKKGLPPEKAVADADAIRRQMSKIRQQIATMEAAGSKDATPVSPSFPKWEIHSGEKIEEAFKRWSATTPWHLIWDGPDIASRVHVRLDGSFEEALQEVVTALNRSGSSIRAYFYRKNNVLRVTGGHR